MMKNRKSWVEDRKRVWRISILVLLGAAFLGPWTFDLIYVPSEYACSAPNIRINENYCGTPLSGIRLYHWAIDGFIYSSMGLATGEMIFIEWAREFLFSLFLFLPVGPFFCTAILILLRDHPDWQKFTIAVWGLDIGLGLLWGISNYPKLFWVVWGIWTYIGLAISALILEIYLSIRIKKSCQRNGINSCIKIR